MAVLPRTRAELRLHRKRLGAYLERELETVQRLARIAVGDICEEREEVGRQTGRWGRGWVVWRVQGVLEDGEESVGLVF
jgi:hypothetical protein